MPTLAGVVLWCSLGWELAYLGYSWTTEPFWIIVGITLALGWIKNIEHRQDLQDIHDTLIRAREQVRAEAKRLENSKNTEDTQ